MNKNNSIYCTTATGKLSKKYNKKLEIWKNYITQLVEEERRPTIPENIEGDLGSYIVKDEVIHAVYTSRAIASGNS